MSTSRQNLEQKIFSNVYIFLYWWIYIFWIMVRTDTLAFPNTYYLVIQVLSNVVALSLGPGQWQQWSKRRKSFLGDASNFNMLQLNSLLPWKQFFLVGGWDSPLGHVTHPTLVQNGCHQCWCQPSWVPAGGTSWLTGRLKWLSSLFSISLLSFLLFYLCLCWPLWIM